MGVLDVPIRIMIRIQWPIHAPVAPAPAQRTPGGKAYPGSMREQQVAPRGNVLSGTPHRGHDADGLTYEASSQNSKDHAIMQVLLEVLHEVRVEAM